eukprot:TRINITY_DN19983_c0_g1::TRINITY_DN19983_c0_g1_i1::g.1280::m.1280 TRINITY_DN19983_c0_g1::TRINITY_DN19983_c0_g1_i1::g.1280  ORF type:complete len:386 (-),score=56.44,ACCA/PF03255.9/43,ACCA/PF03255.9/0.99,DUF972/PF06156.8/1,DUF972/PF06156.8/90,FliD_C/PF07195.7/31,FliD_C/PF07195.7/4.8,AAA_13/PF13166.1/11,GrpE/PF01025.14/1.6,GrpE/PF01025.14/12,DivIC/PF04977.10/2.1,DivIC/PF04977.10/46,DivIC/PF04977.10/1.3e+02 TRINITY_DN19983_c0_g1_i1:24-1181(-)
MTLVLDTPPGKNNNSPGACAGPGIGMGMEMGKGKDGGGVGLSLDMLAMEVQAREFGQCPRVLFDAAHPWKRKSSLRYDVSLDCIGTSHRGDVFHIMKGALEAQFQAAERTRVLAEQNRALVASLSESSTALHDAEMTLRQERGHGQENERKLRAENDELARRLDTLTSEMLRQLSDRDLTIRKTEREAVKWRLLYQSEGHRHWQAEKAQDDAIVDLKTYHKLQMDDMRAWYDHHFVPAAEAAARAAEEKARLAQDETQDLAQQVADLTGQVAVLQKLLKNTRTAHKRQIEALHSKLRRYSGEDDTSINLGLAALGDIDQNPDHHHQNHQHTSSSPPPAGSSGSLGPSAGHSFSTLPTVPESSATSPPSTTASASTSKKPSPRALR